MGRVRTALVALVAAGGSLGLAAGLGGGTAAAAGHVKAKASIGTIVIGSTNFSEQYIVANLYGDVLQQAGFKVQVRANLGTRAEVVPALERGALDLEPDYAGTLLLYLDAKAGAAANTLARAIPALKQQLAMHGATVLSASGALDTNVFAITKATDRKYHLGPDPTLSALKPYASKMVLGGPPECPTFATCEPGLEKVYGLHFKSFKSTDESGPITVAALKSGAIQIGEFFSSDGTIVRNGFVELQDNKHMQAADYLIPVIRKADDTPKVAAVLDKLDAKLSTAQLTQLNIEVNDQHESPVTVAKTWLQHAGL